MTDEHWEEIEQVAGDLQAEIFKGLLEAQGIQVWLSQEGGGHSAYSLTIGKLGAVHLLVPASQSEAARAVLQDYYAGKYEGISFADESGHALPEEIEPPEEDESEDEEVG